MNRALCLAESALVLSLVLVAVCRGSAQAPDWKSVEAEALKTLQGYVRINTSNPPGDVSRPPISWPAS